MENKENFSNANLVALSVIMIMFGIAIGIILGINLENGRMKRIAIKQRVAYYICNPLTGEKTFLWTWGEITNKYYDAYFSVLDK